MRPCGRPGPDGTVGRAAGLVAAADTVGGAGTTALCVTLVHRHDHWVWADYDAMARALMQTKAEWLIIRVCNWMHWTYRGSTSSSSARSSLTDALAVKCEPETVGLKCKHRANVCNAG